MSGRGRGHEDFWYTNRSVGVHDIDKNSSSSEFEPDEASIARCKDDKEFLKMMKVIMAREKEQ